MTTPDFLPFLRSGVGDTPKDGGCLVQVAGFLYDGHSWSDSVTCVHPVLRSAGIRVNDSVDDESRRRLALSAARIAGSNDAVEDWSEQDKKVLNVRLAVWVARQVLHLVRDEDREVAVAAIEAAEAWASDPGDEKKTAASAASAATATATAYAATVAATAYAAAADDAYAAAADAAYAAANAASATAYAAAADDAYAAANAAAADAAYAVAVAADAVAAAAAAKVDLYEGLIDEYDRLTGRNSQPMTPEQGETIRNLSNAMKVTAP